MDNKKILEEINRMNYLFEHKRGVIISEQTTKTPVDLEEIDWPWKRKQKNKGQLTGVDRKKISSKAGNWRKKDSGPINFAAAGDTENVNSNYIARRIPDPFGGKRSLKYLLYSQFGATKTFTLKEGKVTKPSDPDKTPPEIIPLPPLSLSDDNFPFRDNQIGPDFKRYPKASEAFNTFINDLIKFIDTGCIDNMKEITIQGFADSASPTLTNNDHSKFGFSKPYSGLTDDNQQNLFLANNRAKNIMNLIIQKVKENTKDKIDLTNKFRVIDGVSYLGQGSTRRGGKFRKVDVLPNATECKQTSLEKGGSSSIDVVTNDAPDKKDEETKKVSQLYVDLSEYGGPSLVPVEYIDTKNRYGKVYAISRENMNKYKLDDIIPRYIPSTSFNGKSIVNGSISEGKLTVDGFDFGELGPPTDLNYNQDFKYATKSRIVSYNEAKEYVYIRGLCFALFEYSKVGSNSYPKSNGQI